MVFFGIYDIYCGFVVEQSLTGCIDYFLEYIVIYYFIAFVIGTIINSILGNYVGEGNVKNLCILLKLFYLH